MANNQGLGPENRGKRNVDYREREPFPFLMIVPILLFKVTLAISQGCAILNQAAKRFDRSIQV